MTTLNLEKGQKIDLTKGTGLTNLKVGLGWDVNQFQGAAFDLDSVAACLNAEGKLVNKDAFVYFNNLSHPSSAIVHSGDNLTGEGAGDDEVISLNLANVPADVESVEVAIIIFQAVERNQNFGQVNNAYVRVINGDTNEEVARYDLSEDYSTATALITGKVYRHNGEWKFQAVGEGVQKSINDYVAGLLA